MKTNKNQQINLPKLTNQQINEIFFAGEWFLNENDRLERQNYINEAIEFWINKGIIKSNYFEFKFFKVALSIIPHLRPITIEMIENFIEGMVLIPFALKDESYSVEVDNLTRPVLNLIGECLFSDIHRDYVINKIVNEGDSISLAMFPNGFDTINTKDALKNFIKGKSIYPTRINLNELKVQYKIHQEQKFKELYHKLTGLAKTDESRVTENEIEGFPEIFIKTGFQTFKMLDERYKKDNKSLKTKYSNIFWFMEYEGLLGCTQIEYINFINDNYSVKMSKILRKTVKFEDIIQPLLMRYFKGQS